MEDYELQKAVQGVWNALEVKRLEAMRLASTHESRGDRAEEYGYQREADGIKAGQDTLREYFGVFLP